MIMNVHNAYMSYDDIQKANDLIKRFLFFYFFFSLSVSVNRQYFVNVDDSVAQNVS